MKRKKEPTEEEIRTQIQERFDHWNEIATHGCQDPYWEDGSNMNLVRNHILYYYRILYERGFTIMDFFGEYPDERPVPPKVPMSYMVRDGRYPDRLKRTRNKADLAKIIWGYSGQYRA